MAVVTAPVLTIASCTPRSRLVVVDLGANPFPFVAGQAVLVAPHGSALRRPFSIACSPEAAARDAKLELLVASEPNNADLTFAAPGTALDIEGPMGAFVLPRDLGGRSLLFVAGGTGIAPLRSMIASCLEREPRPRVSLLYSARRGDEFAFIDELREHERAGRLELHQTVTRDDTQTWSGRRGRIGRAEFEAALHEPRRTLCFVCGPPSLVDESAGVLRTLGVPPDAIHIEQWGR